MNFWKPYVYHASRSRMFLWAFGLGTLLLGAGVGHLLNQRQPARAERLGERVLATAGLSAWDEEDGAMMQAPGGAYQTSPKLLETLEAELGTGKVAFRDLIGAIPVLAPYFDAKSDVAAAGIFRRHYPEPEAALAADYLAAWNGGDKTGRDRLLLAAQASPPVRFAHHVLGRLEFRGQNYRGAYGHFQQDQDDATVGDSRFYATRSLVEAKDFAELARLETKPEFAPCFDANLRLKVAVNQKDWRAILRLVPLTQWESYHDRVFLVAAFTGLAWGFFLAVLGDIPRLWSGRAVLCLLALVAGVVSTTPTLYLGIFEEEICNLSMGETIIHHFAFFIGGVGVREEVCKLLLFAPFLPWLYRRDSDFEALLVASFVGLGFAMEENGGYFILSEAAAAPGRFLSANFFHIALTGMNGLALYRVCTHGWRGFNQFLFLFPVSVLAHGGYDALLASPHIEGGGYWAMGVYVVFAQYYLHTALDLRPSGNRTCSLTGALVFGMATMAAVALAFQMANLGSMAGATLLLSELLGSVILLFLFFRMFNESLMD